MQVIAARQTGHPASSERLTFGTVSPTFTAIDDRCAVQRRDAHPVIDNHAVPVDAEPLGVQHLAGIGREHRHVRGDREVEPEVDLLIDFLSAVQIGAMVGEARFDL